MLQPSPDLLIRARYPLLYLVTVEEDAALQELEDLAYQKLTPQRHLATWDIARGWDDNGEHKNSVLGALGRVRGQSDEQQPMLFVLKDLHFILQYPQNPNHAPVIRELKSLASELKYTQNTLILTSHTLVVPPELSEAVTVIDHPLPDAEAIAHLITQGVAPRQLELSALGQERLVKACQGLSRNRIERVLARTIAQYGQVNTAAIAGVLETKQQAIRQTGLLEFHQPETSLKQVGGLDNLKQWVRMRKNAFTEEARRYGIPNPKGVLLVGIQGTGKSLSAKTIAHEWQLPLLRLDTGRLFGGLVGESESRVRQMIQIAEAIAPCVLWIDEIDKAFGNITKGIDGDSGTSRRLFGTIITWMQEKTCPVFIVATANDVHILPKELLRKGRFDEIFYLTLPTARERQAIFKVHLQRLRPERIREFDLDLLARQTNNFSGAEIEQVIFDAMHQAFAEGSPGQRRDFGDQDILRAAEATVPLATIAHEQIKAMLEWADKMNVRPASQDTDLLQEFKKNIQQRQINPDQSSPS
ncbi:MAG: AAA family ATPase [Spirulina sp. SIO3F2]|nr:AAA family ATPase [Spirulina sp. SIO3F2]